MDPGPEPPVFYLLKAGLVPSSSDDLEPGSVCSSNSTSLFPCIFSHSCVERVNIELDTTSSVQDSYLLSRTQWFELNPPNVTSALALKSDFASFTFIYNTM